MSSSTLHADTQAAVDTASILLHLVPFAGFTPQIALYCAGLDWMYITSSYCYQNSLLSSALKTASTCVRQSYGEPWFSNELNHVYERYQIFVQLAIRWPKINKDINVSLSEFDPSLGDNITRTHAVKLVGGSHILDGKNKCKVSMYLKRWEKTIFKGEDSRGRNNMVGGKLNPFEALSKLTKPSATVHLASNPLLCLNTNVSKIPPLTTIHINEKDNLQMITSPVSCYTGQESEARDGSFATLTSPTSECNTNLLFSANVYSSNTSSSNCSNQNSTCQKLTSSGISTSSSNKKSRATSKQAYEKKQQASFNREIHKTLFKIETVAVAAYQKNKLLFNSALDAVRKINECIGGANNALSWPNAKEVLKAVNDKRIGQSPERKRHSDKLPEGAFEHLCDLFFSLSAISQHNSEEALTRSDSIELLSCIVDPFFEKQGKGESMDVRKLFERIEGENAYRQDLATTDYRHAIRSLWFTAHNCLMHYKGTEEFLVENGFARKATKEELEIDGEHIKWFPDQMKRGANSDEMSFGLDLEANGLGGRQSMVLVVKGLKRTGNTGQHSSLKITLFLGGTYANEPLPPLIIIPASGEYKKMSAYFFTRAHQVEAKYGHNSVKGWSPMVRISENGSMTPEILQDYTDYIIQMYPDTADVVGKRFFWKLDNGVGRFNKEVLFNARAKGIYIYPGLPNTSEGTQEMDEHFSTPGAILETNRRKLCNGKRIANMGDVIVDDLMDIMFGGEYLLSDGTSTELKNMIKEGFTKEQLASANRKVGYCPATRNALNHPKCRIDVDDNFEGFEKGNYLPQTNDQLKQYISNHMDEYLNRDENNPGLNAYSASLVNLSALNKFSIDKLSELGFDNAIIAYRRIKRREDRVPASQNVEMNTTYPPGSDERRDAMQTCRYPGKYFKITKGGAALNCDDHLIAITRKMLKLKAKELEQRKQKIIDRQKIVDEAKMIVDEKGEPKTNDELKKCIQWKKDLQAKPKGNKPHLQALWAACKDDPSPCEKAWSEVDEKRLKNARDGNCNSFCRSSMFKRAKEVKRIFIENQAALLDQKEQIQVFVSMYKSLSADNKRHLNDRIAKIDRNEDDFLEQDDSSDDSVFSFFSDDDSSITSEGSNSLDEVEVVQQGEYCCASGSYCRATFVEITNAHTCSVCKKPVHSFCLGFHTEGGSSKCARCVHPNEICKHSLELGVPHPPDTHHQVEDIQQQHVNEEEVMNAPTQVQLVEENLSPPSDEENEEEHQSTQLSYEQMGVDELRKLCKERGISVRKNAAKGTCINKLKDRDKLALVEKYEEEETSYEQMRVGELRKLCKERGISVHHNTGIRTCIDRLKNHDKLALVEKDEEEGIEETIITCPGL